MEKSIQRSFQIVGPVLQVVIRGRVKPESIIHSDGWRGYNGLFGLGYKKNIFELIMDKMSLFVANFILMELNLSGTFLKLVWLASVEFINLPLFYI